MQVISTFHYGNFQQKAQIVNIVLRLRMSAYAYANVKEWTSRKCPFRSRKIIDMHNSRVNDVTYC